MVEKIFRMLFYDIHYADYDTRFLNKLDVDHIVKQVVESQAEAFMMTAKCALGSSYYNTEIGIKYPGLSNLDLLKELIGKLHRKNIKVFVWFSALSDKPLWDLHPDWRQRGADGTVREEYHAKIQERIGVIGHMKHQCVCPNSPAGDLFVKQADEIAKNYEIDGFWLDMPYYYPGAPQWSSGHVIPCYCDYCKKKFRKEFGEEIPTTQEDWNLWVKYIRWKRKQCNQWMKKMFDAVRSHRPNAIIGVKGRFPNWRVGAHLEDGYLGDYRVQDVYYRKGDVRTFINLKYWRATSGGKFGVAVCYRQKSVPRAYTFYNSYKPIEHWMQEAFAAITEGCGIMCADYLHLDGIIYDKVIEDVSKILSEVKSREEWLKEAESTKFAALYYSQDSQEFYGEKEHLDHYIPTGGTVKGNLFTTSFNGAFKVMLKEQPFDIAHHKSLNELSEYKVLVLPNVACLSKNEVNAIREYVRNGGGLVATYDTSLYDENGCQLDNFRLADVFGVDYASLFGRTGFWQDYIRITKDHPVTEGVEREYPLQHVGSHIKVRPRKGTKVLGKVTVPYRKDDMNRFLTLPHMPYFETDFPAIVANRFGKGKVVYFPGRIFGTYLEEGLPELKRLMSNAVLWAAKGEPPVTVEAPPNVVINMFKQPEKRRIIVHLLNYQPLEQIVPVHNVKVKIPLDKDFQINQVYIVPEKEKAPYEVEEGYIKTTVPELKIHCMVVVE